MKLKTVGLLSAVLLAPAAAMAQWSDNFDSYPSGTVLDNVGGWTGWDNVAAAAGTASADHSRSAPNSIMISQPSDAVHQYPGTDSGQWTYTAYQFIPRDYAGDSFLILLNTYNHGGPYDWSVQMHFDSTTGMIVDDNHAGNAVAFVREAWAQIRLEIDLDADTVTSFYNDQMVATGTWTSSATSLTSIGAVDLFGNNSTPVYYDDISLTPVPAPGALALLGLSGLVARGRRRR